MSYGLDIRPSEAALVESRARAIELRARGKAGPDSLRLRLGGQITTDVCDEIMAVLRAAPAARWIELTINSNGGRFVPAYDLYIELLRHPAETKIAVIERAESAALLPALAADRRMGFATTEILLHRAAMDLSLDHRWTADRLREEVDTLEWLDEQIVAIVASRTGADPAEIAAEMATEEPTLLDRAMALGIITESCP